MRSLVLAPLLALLAPAPAEASGCFVGPYVISSDPAPGCDVVVLSHRDYGPKSFGVTTQRGTTTVNLTGAITMSTTNLDVFYGNYECDGSPIVEYTESQLYDVYRIALTGEQVGDVLNVSGIGGGTVTASGTCVEDMSKLTPACTGRNSGYPCEDDPGTGPSDGDNDGDGDDDEVGCRVGGTGSAGLLLALLGLVGRRRSVRPAA